MWSAAWSWPDNTSSHAVGLWEECTWQFVCPDLDILLRECCLLVPPAVLDQGGVLGEGGGGPGDVSLHYRLDHLDTNIAQDHKVS